MNNNINQEQKITPLNNSEEHAKIVADLEAEIETKKSKVEEWKNAYLKSEQERLGLKKNLERAQEDVEDWKREACAVKRVQAESKQTKQANDFNSAFIKLQAKKGWAWDESQGWIKA